MLIVAIVMQHILQNILTTSVLLGRQQLQGKEIYTYARVKNSSTGEVACDGVAKLQIAPTVLPIELIYLKAIRWKHIHKLNWATASGAIHKKV